MNDQADHTDGQEDDVEFRLEEKNNSIDTNRVDAFNASSSSSENEAWFDLPNEPQEYYLTNATNQQSSLSSDRNHATKEASENNSTQETKQQPQSTLHSNSIVDRKKRKQRNRSFRHKSSVSDDLVKDKSEPESSQNRKDSTERGTNVLRSVQKVGRHAAQTTKRAVWDTNELSITAAINAVDQWEILYHTIRRLVLMAVQNSSNFYDSVKQSLHRNDPTNVAFVRFVRDWIAIPTLQGIEKLVMGTIMFVQSNEAKHIADESLNLIRHIPWVGSTILVPSIVTTSSVLQTVWNIIQYPIPSKARVRTTVDSAMTFTKWAIASAWNEVAMYTQRADANITRTLSHTQWKVLGSGPYETLPDDTKTLVIDHMCERYYSLSSMTSRYELAAHVKRHNYPLYIDLVATGTWKQRGGSITVDDEWLNIHPTYRTQQYWNGNEPFLISSITNRQRRKRKRVKLHGYENTSEEDFIDVTFSPIWYRLPNVNGEKPSTDAPWIPFSNEDQWALEETYLELLCQSFGGETTGNVEFSQVCQDDYVAVNFKNNTITESKKPSPGKDKQASPQPVLPKPAHPTIAQWYDFDHYDATVSTKTTRCTADTLVDQKRHSVTFQIDSCHWIQQYQSCILKNTINDNKPVSENPSDTPSDSNQNFLNDWKFSPPKASIACRPNFWRFYGPGDEVRRAVWFIDLPGKGLQPFDDDAHSILEDAFMFLQWVHQRKQNEDVVEISSDENKKTPEGDLLTVEVGCPDGATRLVQFSSLTLATAIQQGLGASISLFKLRVYRGSWLDDMSSSDDVHDKGMSDDIALLEDSITRAVEDNGVMGDTIVPNMSLRSLLYGPEDNVENRDASTITMNDGIADRDDCSLATPIDRLQQDDMAKYMYDMTGDNTCEIDHLVLIVHGIGEMLRSADVFGIAMPSLSSIVDCCGYMRKNHAEIQNVVGITTEINNDQDRSKGRVEYLPVEWHEAFAILSQRRESVTPTRIANKPNVMIKDISLKTIPNMRNFANDTLMDVLYFMSPEHHDTIVEVVVNEMNFLVNKFRTITNFNGPISIIGHSLGSIIAWDILNNQPEETAVDEDEILFTSEFDLTRSEVRGGTETSLAHHQTEILSRSTSSASIMHTGEEEIITKYGPRLDFSVSNFFMLGSPVAVFLMIRNQRSPLTDDFYLRGCRRVFNIFHPYDPVAYRIEPCIDPRNTDLDPAIIMHWNGGYRMHYQTRRMWKKFIDNTRKTQRDFVGAFEDKMARIGLLGGASHPATTKTGENVEGEDSASEISSIDDNAVSRYRTGRFGILNEGMRIDYMLQESEIENANEYVAALAAHSSYWPEKDLSLFIASKISNVA